MKFGQLQKYRASMDTNEEDTKIRTINIPYSPHPENLQKSAKRRGQVLFGL